MTLRGLKMAALTVVLSGTAALLVAMTPATGATVACQEPSGCYPSYYPGWCGQSQYYLEDWVFDKVNKTIEIWVRGPGRPPCGDPHMSDSLVGSGTYTWNSAACVASWTITYYGQQYQGYTAQGGGCTYVSVIGSTIVRDHQ